MQTEPIQPHAFVVVRVPETFTVEPGGHVECAGIEGRAAINLWRVIALGAFGLAVLEPRKWSSMPEGETEPLAIPELTLVGTAHLVRTVDVPEIDPAGWLAHQDMFPELGGGITLWLRHANEAARTPTLVPACTKERYRAIEIQLTPDGEAPGLFMVATLLSGATHRLALCSGTEDLRHRAGIAYLDAWLEAWNAISATVAKVRTARLTTLTIWGPHWEWTAQGGWAVVDAGPRRTMVVVCPELGRWMPTAEAQAQIFTSRCPSETAKKLCVYAPLLGRWV